MTSTPSKRPHPIQVILSAAPVVSFLSVWKVPHRMPSSASPPFLAGIAAGHSAPPLLVCARRVHRGAYVRSIDIELGTFVPGGLIGRTEHFFGARAGARRRRRLPNGCCWRPCLQRHRAFVADAMVSGGAVPARPLSDARRPLDGRRRRPHWHPVDSHAARSSRGSRGPRRVDGRRNLATVSPGGVQGAAALWPADWRFRPAAVSIHCSGCRWFHDALAAAPVIPAVGGETARSRPRTVAIRIRALKRSSTLVVAFSFVGTVLTTGVPSPRPDRSLVWSDVRWPASLTTWWICCDQGHARSRRLAACCSGSRSLGAGRCEQVLRRLAEQISRRPRDTTASGPRGRSTSPSPVIVIVTSTGQVVWLSKA